MAESFDCETSSLLCGEDGNSCFDDLSSNGIDEFGLCPPTPQKNNRTNNIEPSLNRNRSQFLMDFPALQSGELLIAMVEKESELLPTDDYLKRLRSGDLDLSVRREALDWIWKANALCGFGPLCMCLATNYLDRFLSLYELPKGKSWAVQLSAVACLSLAAKMEETKFPFTLDLQVGDPKFFFESKTISRMELVVLSTLKWRMHAFTPCSFIDYFLRKMSDDQLPSMSSIHRSIQLILGTIRGIDFLEFKPSEIAAAVAISASGEVKAVDIDMAMACFLYVEKGKVFKCFGLIKDLLLSNRCTNGVPSGSIPQSPVGVLDAACLSYKSDELTTVGSCANSSSLSSPPNNKRRKIDDVGFKS